MNELGLQNVLLAWQFAQDYLLLLLLLLFINVSNSGYGLTSQLSSMAKYRQKAALILAHTAICS